MRRTGLVSLVKVRRIGFLGNRSGFPNIPTYYLGKIPEGVEMDTTEYFETSVGWIIFGTDIGFAERFPVAILRGSFI